MSSHAKNNRLQTLLSALVAISLLFGSLSLVACGNKADEQDNCYGEDMPVVNEE